MLRFFFIITDRHENSIVLCSTAATILPPFLLVSNSQSSEMDSGIINAFIATFQRFPKNVMINSPLY